MLAGGVIALLLLVFFFSPIASFVRGVAQPVFSMGNSISDMSASVFSAFFLGDVGMRMTALERENEDLRRTLENIQEENNRYTAMLERYGENAVSGGAVLSGVLAAPPRSLYDTIVIDHGTESGISVGSEVYTAYDSFVGTVVAVSPYTALVELVSSPGNTIDLLIGKNEKVRAQAFGRGSGNIVAVLPRDIDIAEGDSVTMPGLGGASIGKVDVIETEQNDPFQQIRIRMDVNFHTLTDVAVLPPLVTQFPEYVRSDDVVLDIDMEADLEEESDSGDDMGDDTNATSSDEVEEGTEEEAPQG